MTNDQGEELFYRGVELARKINRSAADKYAEKGLSIIQISMGSIWSAYDIAEVMHRGNGVAAIEWMRTALDIMEKDMLNDNRA